MQAAQQNAVMDDSALYRITFQGAFNSELNRRFENMALSIHYDKGRTITTLFGFVKDQADLYSMLSRIKDKSLTLLLVERLDRPNWPVL